VGSWVGWCWRGRKSADGKGRKCGAPAGAGLTRRQLNPSLCHRAFMSAFMSALRKNGERRAFLSLLPPFLRRKISRTIKSGTAVSRIAEEEFGPLIEVL